MKHAVFAAVAALVVAGLDACGSSADGGGETGAGGAVASGGTSASGGTTPSGGSVGTGGVTTKGGSSGSLVGGAGGGSVGTGGKTGTGGQSGGGSTGTGTPVGVCPYSATPFSCEAACEKLHEIYVRCENDASLDGEVRAMLGLYGQVEIICTSTCAVVAPASQAQWSCFQGVPDDAPCAAISGCNATNCP